VPNKRSLLFDLLAALSGAVLPLAFAPLNIFILAVVSPALAFWCWHGVSPGVAARRGFLFGLGLFGVGVSWVYVAIHDFGFTGAPLAALLTFIFVAFLALFHALQAYLSIRLQRHLPLALHGLVFAMMWMLFEWLRGWVLTGFPWLDLGYSQIDAPLAGFAPILGSYGISMLVVLTAAMIWQLAQQRQRIMWGVLSLTILVWIAGWALQSVEWSQPVGKPLKVAVVQGNLPQLTKWDPDKILHRLHYYAELSEPYWGKRDVIVWPENALTILWQDAPLEYRMRLRERVRQSGTDLVIGLPYANEKTGEYYSSMLVLGKTPGVYNKRHLVPFGEYVPLASLLRGLISFFDLPMSGFSAGDQHQAHLVVAGQPLAPSICYEDAFGSELIDFLPQATLLINGSNNAWYGNSLAPHQHLQISRMRALETARQLIRATTTGISALVDHHGHIIERSPQFKTYVLEGQVQPRTGATPYVRMGNWPVNGTVFTALIVLVILARRRSH
jgi:apolipoprotein N-acyltransferase